DAVLDAPPAERRGLLRSGGDDLDRLTVALRHARSPGSRWPRATPVRRWSRAADRPLAVGGGRRRGRETTVAASRAFPSRPTATAHPPDGRRTCVRLFTVRRGRRAVKSPTGAGQSAGTTASSASTSSATTAGSAPSSTR